MTHQGASAVRARHIAFLGTRGVPANYGGFETFVDQLGRRLVARGDAVTVYCRTAKHSRRRGTFQGMSLVVLPAPHHKYLETVVHGLISAIHALGQPYDLIYVCNVANVPAVLLLTLGRKPIALNVDGLEWRRKKWGAVGRAYYRACSWLAARLPVALVSDAQVIASYYVEQYGRRTKTIAYGSDLVQRPDDGTLDRLGLETGRYVLYVSRLEPENNALTVVHAYRGVPGSMPLVIVGDAPFATAYIAALRSAAEADPRVRLMGSLYGDTYAILQTNAACYVQATEVGGTHPALVEAMGRGVAIAANDVPEHRETLGDTGVYYRGEQDLTRVLTSLLTDDVRRVGLGRAARRRARQRYSWDAIAEIYDTWFSELLAGEQESSAA